MNAPGDDPKFYCNKCLHSLRIFDDTSASVSTTGRSSSSANCLTSCYHVLCGACRPRITINRPAVCPICHKQCQMTEISRSALPPHKQFLFMPMAKAVQLLKSVVHFQDRQIDMFNDRMAKYHAQLAAKLLREQEIYRSEQKRHEQLRNKQAKIKECYRLYKEYKTKRDKQTAGQQQKMLDAKRPCYNRRPSVTFHERPSTSSQQRSSSGSHYSGDESFRFIPSALAAPHGERRKSSHGERRKSSHGSGDDIFGQYALHEQRRSRDDPDRRPTDNRFNANALHDRRKSRDNPMHRPSGVFFDSIPSTPIDQRRVSRDRYNDSISTVPSTLQPHFSDDAMDTLRPKPLATVVARRRFSIEIPETLVSSRMSGIDTPQDRYHRDRYPSHRQ